MSTVEINRDVKMQAKGLIDKDNNYVHQSISAAGSINVSDGHAGSGVNLEAAGPVPTLTTTGSGDLILH